MIECHHDCTSMCRHNGCNCACGEFHEDKASRVFSAEQERIIEEMQKDATEPL